MKLYFAHNTNIWTARYIVAKSKESAQKIALTRISVKDIQNLTVEEQTSYDYSKTNIKQLQEEGFVGIIHRDYNTKFETWAIRDGKNIL